jgi:hypothetical protein
MIATFNVGSSAVSIPGFDTGDVYRPYGEFVVSWQFSPTWHVGGMTRRGLEYVAGLTQPVFVDGLAAELAGLIHPRLSVMTSARYSRGASALNNKAQPFETYSADFQVQYAMNRVLAINGEYLHYFYDFRGTGLAPGITPHLDREGVRVGLTLWVPAVRR